MNWYEMVQPRNWYSSQVIENMVARDGVEPPTPAFSGLYSTNSNPLNLKQLTSTTAPF